MGHVCIVNIMPVSDLLKKGKSSDPVLVISQQWIYLVYTR